jgi:beta-glucosidase
LLQGASQFGTDFQWGVATSAYQIEGAHNRDGKGLSIWDVFTATKGKIPSGTNANVTCDFYHRYVHDLILMSLMGIPNFRFSLSWSRIFPQGTGRANPDGVDFYNRVIDFCLELGIEPWITLYHWDLPYALEQRGGWTNRDIIYWFSDYVAYCVEQLGDRVKHWMLLNEPMAFTGAGYFLGIHAPGRTGLGSFLPAAHHAAMCQSEGGRIIRSLRNDCKIGTTFSGAHVEPYRMSQEDVTAAARIDTLLNRFFIEPLLGLGYPVDALKALRRIEEFIGPDDESKLPFKMDFIGVQSYTREVVKHSYFVPFVNAQIVKAERRAVHTTAMKWEVYPQSIYSILKKYAAYANIPQIIVTENGAAFPDTVIKGKVHDEQRIVYLQQHIAEVLKAREEGVNVGGYFVWTLMDNFEWAEGYNPRFGLVYVDFKTQQRIIKASGQWYGSFLGQ